MADLERFGGELFLKATQYISTIGQVERANIRLESSLKQTGNAVEQMGLKFDTNIKNAGKVLLDLNQKRFVNIFEGLHRGIDQSVQKYAQLASSGRASHQVLLDSLLKLERAENAYRNALENVASSTRKAGEAGRDDADAQARLNKSVNTARSVYLSYLQALGRVDKAQENVNKENFAIIQSYALLQARLKSATSLWSRLGATWQTIISKAGALRNALFGVQSAAGGAGGGGGTAAVQLGFLGKAAGAAGVALGLLGSTLGVIGKLLGGLLSPLRRVIDSFKRFLSITTQIAVGILIRDTIRGLIRELRDLATAGFEAVKFFQALDIRLELMEARAIRAEGSLTKFSDIMSEATGRAQRLQQWLKELSLTSPFSIETIATTQTLNMAMGFTEDMAKRLTVAIANYTAGMGLSNQVMERIVFNFGQMKAAGKVTATELRDLARGAFLPMQDILTETARIMGVTIDDFVEFREELSKGGVSVDTFFRAFLNVVERDFSDASQRFSRTLEGLRNRLGNFIKTVIGLEVLKPVFDRIAEAGSQALDRILQPELITRARLLGLAIQRSFDLIRSKVQVTMHVFRQLWAAMGFGTVTFESLAMAVAVFTRHLTNAIDFVRKILRRLLDYFDETGETIVDRMSNFGYNAVAVFANGMAAAVHLVVRVLNWIGNAISNLLSPGSPPKLLPDLPEWGMEAMAEWLRGFTLADFDILEGIQDPLKDVLDILEETGQIAENAAGKIFADLSKAIAEALATGGGIPEELLARIEQVGGGFGVDLVELARRQIAVADATEAVRLAEERLENARKAHEAARIKTNKLIREYNESLREGADPEFLKAKLEEINASEDAARAAYEEQKAAEEDLDKKKDFLEVVEEQLKLQEKLIDQLIELTKAQIIQPEQPEQPGGGGGGEEFGEEEGLGELPPLPEPELPDPDEIANKLDEIFLKARQKVDEQWQNLRTAWEESGLGQAFEDLGETWSTVWTNITDFYDTEIQPRLDRIVAWWDENWPRISEIFADAGEIISETWADLQETFSEWGEALDIGGVSISIEGVLDTILGLVQGVVGGIALVVSFILNLIDSVLKALLRMAETFDKGVERSRQGIEDMREAWANLTENFTWENFEKWLDGLGEVIAGFFDSVFGSIFDGIEEFVDGVVGWFVDLWDRLVGNSVIPEMMDDIYDAMTQPIEDIKEFIIDKLQSVVDWLRHTFFEAIDDVKGWLDDLRRFVIDDLIPDIRSLREKALKYVYDYIVGPIETALEDLQTWFDNVKKKAVELKDKVIELKDKAFQVIHDYIRDTLGPKLGWLKTHVLDPLVTGFDAVKSAIGRLIAKAGELITKLAGIPLGILEYLSGKSPSPFAIGIDSAADAMKRMSRDALPRLSAQLLAMQSGIVMQSPVVSAAPVAANNSNAVTVNMGGVVNNTGMDDAIFEARVRNIIEKSLRG